VIPVLVGFASVLSVLAIVIWLPIGPITTVSGRILAMGSGGGRYARSPWVKVLLPGRDITFSTYYDS
jgi:hypothetical protein